MISGSQRNHGERIRAKYSLLSPGVQKNNRKKKLTELLANVGWQTLLLRELEVSIRLYAQHNLNRIGTGDNFTTEEVNVDLSEEVSAVKSATKVERAKAVNMLLELINTSSADSVYSYVMTPYFKQLSGMNEYKFNIFRSHLDAPIREFINIYEEKLTRLHADYVLVDVLLDPEIRLTISREQLTKLFWQYNSIIIADVIVNVYEDKAFLQPGTDLAPDGLTYEMLDRLLRSDRATIDYVNRIKAKFSAALIMPEHVLSPGRNPLSDEALTIYQLYQYDESTVIAIEEWLRKQYLHLLVNNIKGNNVTRAENTKNFFYQIPAAPYMLLDPADTSNANYFRYRDFKRDLKSLIASYDPLNNPFGKPVIFFGIINIDGTHYVPYFIHKNKHQHVSVITVDPSAYTYPSDEIRSGVRDDGKVNTRWKLKNIFDDLLPGCNLYDPGVNQMLRERDCGPNSATTLYDALSSATTPQPLLELHADVMAIFPERLSVNYDSVGINPYTKKFVYPLALEKASLQSRAAWEERLRGINMISSLTERVATINPELPLSMYDEYDPAQQMQQEYNYVYLVEQQQQQDLRETNISAVQSSLLARPEFRNEMMRRLIDEYRQTLELPNADDLVEFIRANTVPEALPALLSAHDGDIRKLADDVVAFILRDDIPNVIEHAFTARVVSTLPMRTDLDPGQLVDNFLRQHDSIYSKLNIYHQRSIKSRLHTLAAEKIQANLHIIYRGIIYEVVSRNCVDYLAAIPAEFVNDIPSVIYNKNELADHEQLYKHDQIATAYAFLKMHAPNELQQLIRVNVERAIEEMKMVAVSRVVTALDFHNRNLSSMLTFLSRDENAFKPWMMSDLMAFISSSHIVTLAKINAGNVLGVIVLEHVNKAIYKEVRSRINQCIISSIRSFLSQQAIHDEFTTNQSIASLSAMIDADGNIRISAIDPFNFNSLIERFGHTGTLTTEDYAHPVVTDIVNEQLWVGLGEIIRLALTKQYENLAQSIMLANHHNTLVSNIASAVNLLDLPTAAMQFFDEFKLLSINGKSVFSAMTADESLNECGQRFHRWFVANTLQSLIDALGKANLINQNITNSLALLEGLKAQLSLGDHGKLIAAINTDLSVLENMLKRLNVLSLGEDSVRNYATLAAMNKVVLIRLQKICTNLLSFGYSIDEVKPGSVTVLVRPVLCALLGVDAPAIVTDEIKAHRGYSTAQMLDARIRNALPNLLESQHVVQAHSALLPLRNVERLPDSCGKPLTRSILIDCISCWLSSRSIFSSEIPEFIRLMIEIVNVTSDMGELDDKHVTALRRFLLFQRGKDVYTIYQSKDLLHQIQGVILRSSSISNLAATNISFGQLSGLFSDMKVVPEVSSQTRQISANDLMREAARRMNAQRDPVTRKLPQGVTLETVKQTILHERGLVATSPQGVNVGTTLQQVKKNELQPDTSFIARLFGTSLTELEKRLQLIKLKHDNSHDFQLDQDDVNYLQRQLYLRWEYLLKKYKDDTDAAATQYLINPRRKDKVYIAMAEILAKYYRSTDRHAYAYDVLMPNYSRFLPASRLLQHQFPKDICIDLNLNQDETTIDDIHLANLVTIRTGYALDINWIIDAYRKFGKLTNPYNGEQFTNEELDDISFNANADELLKSVAARFSPKLTQRALSLLVNYINKAVFATGFGGDYTTTQNANAFAAYTAFNLALMNLPAVEREALLQETIPGKEETVGTIFENSQIPGNKSGALGGKGSCLTYAGVELARVVIAYKGMQHHGIKNADVVNRAGGPHVQPIQPRSLVLDKTLMSMQESYLYEKVQQRGAKRLMRK